ncbi:MAG: hypothetical protein J0H34_17310 [Rhizobiales bacterium]|nr:hypothetical protein [Hyphomicrobiales bacterium]
MSEWMPLVAAALSIVGAAMTYAWQRSIDRRDKLREKKQIAYEAFLHGLYNASEEIHRDPSSDVMHDRFQLARLSVFLFAPDDVVEKAGRYVLLIQDKGGIPVERRRAFAEMIKSMRADTFEKTKLSSEQIIRLAPLNHPDEGEVSGPSPLRKM